MKVYRIDLTAWTASFRYPNLISGVQPTLEVPPLSTIMGILNAASGQYLSFRQCEIGYYLEYEAKTFDLETIYMIPSNKKGAPLNKDIKSNIIQREFLFNAKLSLYLKDKALVEYLSRPFYDILLGRSGDLAKVSVPRELELEAVNNATKVKGQIIPLRKNFLPGKIQALPKYFTNEIPRNNLGTEPYTIIPHYVPDFNTKLTTYRDHTLGKKGIDIYFHNLDFTSYD